jgi:hypothetical protein
VRLNAHACRAGGVRHAAGVVRRDKRGGQSVLRQQGGADRVGIAENQDKSVRAASVQHLPQGDGLVNAGDGEGAAAGLHQCLGAGSDTVAVGIRLDYGYGGERAAGGSRCRVRQQAVVVGQCRRIDGGVYARRGQPRREQFMQAVYIAVVHDFHPPEVRNLLYG